jgi:hypothetical protein
VGLRLFGHPVTSLMVWQDPRKFQVFLPRHW